MNTSLWGWFLCSKYHHNNTKESLDVHYPLWVALSSIHIRLDCLISKSKLICDVTLKAVNIGTYGFCSNGMQRHLIWEITVLPIILWWVMIVDWQKVLNITAILHSYHLYIHIWKSHIWFKNYFLFLYDMFRLYLLKYNFMCVDSNEKFRLIYYMLYVFYHLIFWQFTIIAF